jgi:hypothetical protein
LWERLYAWQHRPLRIDMISKARMLGHQGTGKAEALIGSVKQVGESRMAM